MANSAGAGLEAGGVSRVPLLPGGDAVGPGRGPGSDDGSSGGDGGAVVSAGAGAGMGAGPADARGGAVALPATRLESIVANTAPADSPEERRDRRISVHGPPVPGGRAAEGVP